MKYNKQLKKFTKNYKHIKTDTQQSTANYCAVLLSFVKFAIKKTMMKMMTISQLKWKGNSVTKFNRNYVNVNSSQNSQLNMS